MELLYWIVVGAIAGWLVGFLASWFFNMPDAVNGFNLTSIVVVVIRLLRGGGRSSYRR